MTDINIQLKKYIFDEIFPLYERNDSGHQIDHIQYVINRSLEFAFQFKDINLNMVYAVACFHDLAHYIDKDRHEVLSAELFYNNAKMKEFFTDEQRVIIKEAIEDHRASLESIPRSCYGKIISSVDRNVNITSSLKRVHAYTIKHYPELDLDEMIHRAYQYINRKFGENGYAKSYCVDLEFEDFKKNVKELLLDYYKFGVKYMEVNHIMDVKEKAKLFAIKAHMGQVRKSEADKPMIMHPIAVGYMLESFGYDDAVVAAGYLHDVVEDTQYTIDDIRKEFGEDIASLVYDASEPDKSLSWEVRKKYTIDKVKNLPFRNKLVICADKINNLEDLYLIFEKSGKRDFSAFKRGEELQRWYYTGIYESLISGEDESLAIFARLKDVIDKMFFGKEDLFLRDTVFIDHLDYYKKLRQLHAMKRELQNLKSLCSLPKPFVVEFSGTPRTGKTTTIHNLYDFFKKGGFDVLVVEEFTSSKKYKEKLKLEFERLGLSGKDIAVMEEVYKELQESVDSDNEIVLIDRSINDRQVWNYRRYQRGDMSQDQYQDVKDKYSKISKELIDFLVVTYADPLISLQRDYMCSLALEKRRFLNQENIEEYNNSLSELESLFSESVDSMLLLDTSNLDMNDVSVEVCFQILPVMREKYIESFCKKYHLK